jgi:hypothetical protein
MYLPGEEVVDLWSLDHFFVCCRGTPNLPQSRVMMELETLCFSAETLGTTVQCGSFSDVLEGTTSDLPSECVRNPWTCARCKRDRLNLLKSHFPKPDFFAPAAAGGR